MNNIKATAPRGYVGPCRFLKAAILLGEDALRVVRSRKFKSTTDSDHSHNLLPNLLDGDFEALGANRKWAGELPTFWTGEGGSNR